MALPDEFHEAAKRVNNWGRWGDADERGTLNLITDEVVRAAAATVRTGRRVALALPLQQNGVQTGLIPGRVNPLRTMTMVNWEMFGPDTVATSDDVATLGLQAATHWDGLGHVSHSGRIYNGRPAASITPHGGASFAGIEKAGPVVSRGVLLDVARAHGADELPDGYAITPDDLDAAEGEAGTRVRPGDIVLVRTGRMRRYLAGDAHAYGDGASPGLSRRTPEWFHARDTAAVATDTIAFEVIPPEDPALWLPVHALHLVEMGMPQGQNWNLEELARVCSEAGRYEFLLTATPEPFTGGTGAPVAPVAVL